MPAAVEVRSPLWPVCWRSCGNCAGEGVFVTEVLIAPGDVVRFNQTIVRTETSKVSTDVPTSVAGRVVSVHVPVGDAFPEDTLIAMIERDAA